MKRWNWTYGIVAALAALWGLPVISEAGSRRALVIGNDDYAPQTKLPRLRYAAADAHRMAEVLAQGGYAVENIRVLTSGAEDPRQIPTHENIIAALQELARTDPAGATEGILLLFAGHGFNHSGESHLCPTDFNPESPVESSLRVAELADLMAQSEAREKYVVIDACRNEAVADETREFNLLTGLKRMRLHGSGDAQGIVFFSSCLAGQQSYEDPQLKNGVFLHFFANGLEGYADYDGGNHDGQVSAFEAIEYAARQTSKHVQSNYDARQSPWADSHSTATMCVTTLRDSIRKRMTEELGERPEDHAEALKRVTRQQAEGEFEEAIGSLASGDHLATIREASRAIAIDPEYYMARRLRALLKMIQGNASWQLAAKNYGEAIQDMAAVESKLRIKLLRGMPLQSGSTTAAVLEPGDVVLVEELRSYQNEPWLKVVGIRRREAGLRGDSTPEAVVGFIKLASVANPESNKAQLEDFLRKQKPTQSDLLTQTARYRPGGDGTRLAQAQEALGVTTMVLSQIPGATVAVPYTGMAGGIISTIRQARGF